MRYHFKVHKEGNGFWAECLEIPECLTQGDTKERLFKNMQDAINMYLEESKDSTHMAPFPDSSLENSRSIIEVSVDPAIAFAFTVRCLRIKKGLTQKQAAKKLGMKNVFSYQRLERRCNASLEIISKVRTLFPSLSLDMILS